MTIEIYKGNDTNALEDIARQIEQGGGGGGIPDAPPGVPSARMEGEWVPLDSSGYVRLLTDMVTTKTVGTAPGSDFADYGEAALWAQQHIGQALVLVLTSNVPGTAIDNYEFNSFGFVGIQSGGFTSPAGLYRAGYSIALLDTFTATGEKILQFFGLTIVDEAPANAVIVRADNTEQVQIFDAQIKEGFYIEVSGTARTQVFGGYVGGSGGGIITSGHLWLEGTVVGNATAADCSMHAASVINGNWTPTSAVSPSINMGNGSEVGGFDYSELPGEVETFATFNGFVSVGNESDPTGKYENLLPAPYAPNALSPIGIFSMASRPMP